MTNDASTILETVSELRTPPHSIAAEQMIIGGLLFDQDAYIEVSNIIKECHFYRPEHQIIFRHIAKLKSKNRAVDPVTIVASLNESSELEFVGDIDYINNLAEATVSTVNIVAYAQIVCENYIRRELARVAKEISDDSYSATDAIPVLVDKCEQKIFAIKNNTNNKKGKVIVDSLPQVVDKFTLRANQGDPNQITGLATHYVELDKYTSGLQQDELIILAGRPGMGKTAFALNIAQNVSMHNNLPVAIFSLEMGEEQLIQRFWSAVSKVPYQNIKSGYADSNNVLDKLYAGVTVLKNLPIYIYEVPGINVIDICLEARRLKSKQPNLSLIIIDYVQIMSSLNSKYNNRAQDISDISRNLKCLAVELKLPIILLSQLNREVENRQDKRPYMSDLKESGALEQDADIVMLLYRDEYYNKQIKLSHPDYQPSEKKWGVRDNVPDNKNKAELNIAKNRNGETGTFELMFNAECMRFENLYKG